MSSIVRLPRPAAKARTSSHQYSQFSFPTWERSEDEFSGFVTTAQEKVHVKELAKENVSSDEMQELLLQEFQRGYEEGKALAEKMQDSHYEKRLGEERQKMVIKTLGQLESLMENMQKEFINLQSKSEEIVLKFALAVSEQILKREVRIDSTVVLQQIKESLKRVLGVEHIKIRVNPLDEAIVREHKSSIVSGSDSLREMVIEGDEKVERGGCILESDSGNVDARITTQMKKIESVLINDGVLTAQ